MNRDDASAVEVASALRELDELSDGFVLVLVAGPRGGEAAIESMSAKWRGDWPMRRHDIAADGADLGAAAHRVGARGFLVVTGLERLDAADQRLALREANLGRDRLQGSTARVVWWVDDASVPLIRDVCPDLWSWVDLNVRVSRLGPRPTVDKEAFGVPQTDRLLAALTSGFRRFEVSTPSSDRIAVLLAGGRDLTIASAPGFDAIAKAFRGQQDSITAGRPSTTIDGRSHTIADIAAWHAVARESVRFRPVGGALTIFVVSAATCFPTRPPLVDLVLTPIHVVDVEGTPDPDELARMREIASAYGRWDLLLSPAELRVIALASSGLDEPFVDMLRDAVLRRIDDRNAPIADVVDRYRQRLVEQLTPEIARAIVGFIHPTAAGRDDAVARDAVRRGLLLPWTDDPLTWRVHALLSEDVARQAAPLLDASPNRDSQRG